MVSIISRGLASPSLKLIYRSLGLVLSRSRSYYITTPIYYVNASPHIGHLYTLVLADAACRWKRLKADQNVNCRLVGGTDEHGLKVMKAASLNNIDMKQYCDQLSGRFKELYNTFDIDFYDFVRTSEERHVTAVAYFWKTIYANGYIYKGMYEGWYCTSDETFVPETDVEEVHDKQSDERFHVHIQSKKRLEWTKEVNYKFKLTKFTDKIRDWITDNDIITPDSARASVLSLLDNTSSDLSVSRERNRVKWGIQVPNDPTQTVYVWMDALVNYLTATGYPDTINDDTMWPADVHLIGVDIIRFHAIYWPAFLMAAGLKLPDKIVVHSHWTVDNVKMSKSIGNVVDPFKVAKKLTPTGLRYFLLKQGVLDHHCNFSSDLAFYTVNSDLANDIGNCLHRATAKHLNPAQTYPPFHKRAFPNRIARKEFFAGIEEYDFIEKVRNLPDVVDRHSSEFHFYKSLFEIADTVRKANLIIQRHRLWTCDMSIPEQREFMETLIHSIYEGLRVCGILLQPFVPDVADKLLNKLGVPPSNRTWKDAKSSFLEFEGCKEPLVGRGLGTGEMLFKRLKQ